MTSAPFLTLHGYWRSGASYRTQITHDLRKGEQGGEAYRAINPQGLVPAMVADHLVLTQSAAILEWLEERYPDPPLLPAMADDRAIMRAMALVIACDPIDSPMPTRRNPADILHSHRRPPA